jgi:adiponectin receptor
MAPRLAAIDAVVRVAPWNALPHIVTRYRVNHGLADSLLSWFSSHNDLLNIWTHFLGLLYFFYNFWRVKWALDGAGAAHPQGRAVPTFAYALCYAQVACAAAQMLASVAYHTLRCVSQHHEDIMFRVDLVGISVLIAGSYMTGLYLGFGDCHLGAYLLYIGAVLFCIGCVLATLVRQRDMQAHFAYLYRMLGLAVGIGVLPCLHWLWLCSQGEVQCLPDLPAYMAGMMGSYSLGYLFFMLHFPESLFPRSFDLVGASHQIWHVLVFSGSAFWVEAVLDGIVVRHGLEPSRCLLRSEGGSWLNQYNPGF